MKKEYNFSKGVRGKFYHQNYQSNMKIEGFKIIERNAQGTKSIMQTILSDDGKRPAASEYIYPRREFTERQENFYQNLLRMYRIKGKKTLPIYFLDKNGKKLRLDRGCVAMAVHDGFLKPLENDNPLPLTYVTLNW